MSLPARIALAGNPNAGKSSLFNLLTGLKQRIANYPGVTVEEVRGKMRTPHGDVEIVDLPGTYSLIPKSPDEAVAVRVLAGEIKEKQPELVVYVADAANLKRHLVFLSQIIDMGLPMVLALNMMDIAEADGIHINIGHLEKALDIPVVGISSRSGKGIDDLKRYMLQPVRVSAATFVNKESQQVAEVYKALRHQVAEGKADIVSLLSPLSSGAGYRADYLYRHKTIGNLVEDVVTQVKETGYRRLQQRIDEIVTHPVLGYVIFAVVLFLLFQAIFLVAQWPMDLIEAAFAWGSEGTNALVPPGMFNDLVTNGVIPGLSGVLVFVPQIALLFLFISVLESTGYLARVAFMLDRSFKRFGLSGKSVIPLLSGAACAVPAIMAARSIENRKIRLVTIFVTPLVSCSARLPVFVLLIALAVPEGHRLGIFNMQGVWLMGLYAVGFLSAIAAARIVSWAVPNPERQYFILELPLYKAPRLRNVLMDVYNRVRIFVKEAGTIIFTLSIILWFLGSFGPLGGKWFAPAEELKESYVGRTGQFIEPVFRPLGYDWKISIGILTSFAARETFVSTMSTLYGTADPENEDASGLREKMRTDRSPSTGNPVFSFASIVSLLVFYLFALQCMSTVAITLKETGSIRFAMAQFASMGVLAYISAFIVYQLLK